MKTTDPILKLMQLMQELWNEKKILGFDARKAEQKRTINRMEKLINEIKELHPKLDMEIKMLREIHKIEENETPKRADSKLYFP